MLKNKFGMGKILALVLSVLMLVTLAACNKNDDSELQDALKAAQQAAEAAQAAADEAARQASEAESRANAAESKANEVGEQVDDVSKDVGKVSSDIGKVSDKVDQTTTTAKTTQPTTQPTTAPQPADNIDAYTAEYYNLKTTYTVSKADLYLADDYAELCLIFDKAGVQLNNATTKAAAQAIVETLKVDIAAIDNAETVANKVQAMIDALGDVETEVFTTAYEKVDAADEAFLQMLIDFEDYFETKFADNDDKSTDNVNEWDEEAVEDLGVDYAALKNAVAKIDVLTDYIESSLQLDLGKLYAGNGYSAKFDEDGDDLNDTNRALIKSAYYKYLVLKVVNGGDVAEADLPIDWEYLYDNDNKVVKITADNIDDYDHPLYGKTYAEGSKVYDEDEPVKWFTIEEFLDVFATPYLNEQFEAIKTTVVNALKVTLATENGLYKTLTDDISVNSYVTIATWSSDDVDDAFDDILDQYVDEVESLSFVGDYKGNATIDDAAVDVYTKYVEAYIDACNAFVEIAKEVAIEAYTESIDDQIDDLDSDATTYATKLANLQNKLALFTSNVEAAPTYALSDLNDVELLKAYDDAYDKDDEDYDIMDYITETGVDAKLIAYINDLYVAAVEKNFKASAVIGGTYTYDAEEEDWASLIEEMVEDLEALYERLDPTSKSADLYQAAKGARISYMDTTAADKGYVDENNNNYYYENVTKFVDLCAQIDAAIESLNAIDVANYTDSAITLKVPDDSGTYGSANYKQPVYWINEEAKTYAESNYETQKALETAVINMLKAAVNEKAAAENVSKSNVSKITGTAELVTLTNTGLPVTYTKTASAQAALAAQTIYNKIYTNLHAVILECKNYVADYQRAVCDFTYYDAIIDSVSGNADLKAEVEAFASLYSGYMTTYSALKYSFSTNSYVTGASESVYLNTNGLHITVHLPNDDDTSNNKTVTSNAKNYKVDGVVDDLEEYLAIFQKTFYTDDSMKNCTIVELWNYKTEAVAKITALVESMKNTYDSKSTNNGSTTITTNYQNAATKGYAYDEDRAEGYSSASSKGAAYEAQLDSLLASYVSKIQGVKLSSAVKVANALGDTVLKKYDQKVYDVDGNGSISGANETIEKVTFNLAVAKSIVNAYVVDLLGYESAKALNEDYVATGAVQVVTTKSGYDLKKLYDSTTTTIGGKDYADADSRIFTAYKTYYLGDYTTITLD